VSTKRYDALSELRTRLRTIRAPDGFETDAGQLVFLGEEPVLGPDDPAAAIAIVVGGDEPRYQGQSVVIFLPVEVQAHVRANVDDPWLTIEAVVGDIKKAIETDHDLGGILLPRGLERGTTRPKDRESGSAYVAAGVEYKLLFREQWGAP
jgi:hypothetical protein